MTAFCGKTEVKFLMAIGDGKPVSIGTIDLDLPMTIEARERTDGHVVLEVATDVSRLREKLAAGLDAAAEAVAAA